MKAHSTAIKSFNLNHLNYDIFRPNFQKPLVEKFLIDLNLLSNSKPQTGKKIVELAAGTGKFTSNLVNYGWSDNLVVVEPSEGMLKSFHKNFPQVKSFLGSSYKIPMEDHSVDAIVVAQGFHWFSDLESLKEVKRVLKPEGKFGCIWNFDGVSTVHQFPSWDVKYLFDPEINVDSVFSTEKSPYQNSSAIMGMHEWYQKVTEYIYSYDVNVPQYRHGKWKQLLNDNPYFKNSGIENYYYYKLLIEPKSVYDYWLTRSYITSLSEEEKLKVKERVEEILDEYVEDQDMVQKDGKVYLQRIMGGHTIVTEPTD